MRLFNDIRRDYLGPALSSESLYSFLDRSARPYANNVRVLLEQWFCDYRGFADPESTGHLQSRIRDSDDRHFIAAFFELYCFALTSRQGFTCRPEPQAEEKTYDFRIERDGRPAFFLECVTVSGVSDDESKSDRRVAAIEDTLNRRICSTEFFLIVKIAEGPSIAPPIARLCPQIDDWLSGIDPDSVEVDYKDTEERFDPQMPRIPGLLETTLPRLDKEVGGWEFTFFAVPRRRGATSSTWRPVGSIMRMYGENKSIVRWMDCKKPLMRALEEKARRYGDLEAPFVIAVNATDRFVDKLDIQDVMAGTHGIHEPDGKGNFELAEVHLENFWFRRGKPVNTRVGGVLTVIRLNPFSIASQTPLLWCNPWASDQVDLIPWQGPKNILVPQSDKIDPLRIDALPGSAATEILQISPAWPIET